MTFRSRTLRSLLAASTLHLLLAVPARACPSETTANATDAAHAGHSMSAPAHQMAHEMPASMPHAGHHMAGQVAPASEQAPDTPPSPRDHHMPCCPNTAAGCASMGCASLSATLLTAVAAAPVAHGFVSPSMTVSRWVSFVHAPEPPPPRV